MEKRIDLARKILADDEKLYHQICPDCYHILKAIYGKDATEVFLICQNEMCLNDEEYVPDEYISPFRIEVPG